LTAYCSFLTTTTRQGFVLALFFCVASLFAGSALAGDEATPQSPVSDTVVFAIPDVWPWAYKDSSGEPQGSLVEIVKRLSELTGVPVEPRLRPLRRALIELDSGEVNFSLLFESPELDARAINVARLAKINLLLAALADTNYPLSLEALEGKRIGYIRGTYLGEAFKREARAQKVPVSVISQGIEMLPLNRLSAILASDHAILRSLKTMGLSRDFLRYSKHVDGQPGALYMSRKAQRPQAAKQFRDAIATMIENGEMSRIFFGEQGRPKYSDSLAPTAQ
jgi:ABC-type amino acid transport substrate-binding protein